MARPRGGTISRLLRSALRNPQYPLDRPQYPCSSGVSFTIRPIFWDKDGAFGDPPSDTDRTCTALSPIDVGSDRPSHRRSDHILHPYFCNILMPRFPSRFWTVFGGRSVIARGGERSAERDPSTVRSWGVERRVVRESGTLRIGVSPRDRLSCRSDGAIRIYGTFKYIHPNETAWQTRPRRR